MAPILVFVGLEICAQAFYATQESHHRAVALSFLPIVAYLVLIQSKSLLSYAGLSLASLKGEMATTYQTLLVLANGFIITSLLWGSTLAMIIDKRLKSAAVYMGIGALFTVFGVIHSPYENGKLFWPWGLESPLTSRLFFAYLMLMGLLFFMDWYDRGRVHTGGN
jgi:AGZA family xanthine/uracil permease-like MFS transporter